MNKTKIEWVKNPDGTQGYTWNPITGCLNGCPYCYARKLANGRLRERYLANRNRAPFQQGSRGSDGQIDIRNDPFYPRFWPERFGDIPLKPPKGIFVCDMGELFGDWLPRDWQDRVFAIIEGNPQHRFYLLTKQPQNLIKFSPFPENCWVGVTATNEHDILGATNCLFDHKMAKTQFLSIEPLLSWDTSKFVYPFKDSISRKDLDWVIIGACTGTLNDLKPMAMKYPDLTLMPYGKIWTLQPKLDWIREIVEAADNAGIPVFLKDNLMPLMTELSIPDLAWYADLWRKHKHTIYVKELRQEMPK